MNAGASGAIEAACERHHPMLLRIARNFLKPNPDGAEDAVQDTLERFVLAFPDGPPPAPQCGSWLSVALVNHLISGWRKKQGRHRLESDPALLMAAAPQPISGPESLLGRGTVDEVMEKATPEDFTAAVDAMSPKLRAVYELHMLGRKHREIAAELKITVVAARKRLFAARRFLEARLRLLVDEDEDDR